MGAELLLFKKHQKLRQIFWFPYPRELRESGINNWQVP